MYVGAACQIVSPAKGSRVADRQRALEDLETLKLDMGHDGMRLPVRSVHIKSFRCRSLYLLTLWMRVSVVAIGLRDGCRGRREDVPRWRHALAKRIRMRRIVMRQHCRGSTFHRRSRTRHVVHGLTVLGLMEPLPLPLPNGERRHFWWLR